MNLLLKLLRPERVPSPNRKKIPFGTRLQLFLYRSGLKRLKKKYCRCAYSDTMIIVGNPSIKVYHEFRDISFETELKRLNIPFTEGMIECTGATSHHPEKHKRQPSYNQFHFCQLWCQDFQYHVHMSSVHLQYIQDMTILLMW